MLVNRHIHIFFAYDVILMVSCFSPEFEKQFGSCSYPEKGNFPGRNLKAIFPSLRKKWGVGSGGWGVTLKLVGREIVSVVKLGGEKWEVGRGGVGGRAVPFLPIPSREISN